MDGSPFGSVTGVTVGKDGTVTAQFSNGLSQEVYKIPLATFTNPDGLGQVSGNAYVATKSSGAANINLADTGGAGAHPVQFAGRLDRGSGDRVHQPDHHPARLFARRRASSPPPIRCCRSWNSCRRRNDERGKAL